MKIASFDFFTKTKEDIDTSSAWGGLYSILAFIFGVLLIITEFNSYMEKEWKKEMSIDNILATNLQVNIDILFQKTPCHLLTLELEDDNGNHKPEGPIPINKVRLNKDQNIIKEPIPADTKSEEFMTNFLNAISNQEKCRIFGNFSVSAAPGNFHISFHNFRDNYYNLSPELKNEINFEFDLNHLSFGKVQDQSIIRKMFYPNKIDFSPYKKLSINHEHAKMRTDYFIKIVSNKFSKNEKDYLQGFQYSLNSKETEIQSDNPPAVYFTYEMTPITIIYTLEYHPFSHFLVQICAILGGIFAVMGIINSLTLESISLLRNKIIK